MNLTLPCAYCGTSPATAAELHAATRNAGGYRLIDGHVPAKARLRVVTAMAALGQRIACAERHDLETGR